MNFSEFKNLVFKEAEAIGLTEFDLYHTNSSSLSIDVFESEIDKFSSITEIGVCFRCLVSGKMGYSFTELLSQDEAKRLVRDAKSSALCIESDDEEFIFEGSKSYEQVDDIELSLSSAKTLSDMALELEKSTLAEDTAVTAISDCSVSESVCEINFANSKGLTLSKKQSFAGAVIAPVVDGEGDEKYNKYDFVVTDKADKIDVHTLAKSAVDKTKQSVGATSIESGTYKAVISSLEMAGFLSTFSDIFSSDAVQRGLSLLKDKEGEAVASDIVTIVDNPLYSGVPNVSAFDDVGVATYCKNVVENGILKTLLYNLKTAKKAGKVTTGNGFKSSYASKVSVTPSNFYIKPDEKVTEQDLFAFIENGILITEIRGWHSGANSASGDFSMEAGGFVIENGKKGRPVEQITISGNFYTLLMNITKIANNLKFDFPRGSSFFGSPSVAVSELIVAGK